MEIVARLGVAPGRVTVIPHRVDAAIAAEPGPGGTAGIARLRLCDGQPVLLYVGSWQPRKNIPALLAAAARLRAGGRALRLVLAGKVTARERDAVRAAAGPLLDAPDVAIAGEVTDAELAALYRRATVVVYPSSYEGFGLPVAEALAAGVPVVAGACGAVAEVAGGAARLVPDPSSADALAAAIGGLLDAPAERARLADLGRRRAAVLRAAAEGSAYHDLVRQCLHMQAS
jgi:glycosyltransferase involved in cell wall biosynthesis